jgi:ElaB/YqjD/DUF883 family membrane-anchored ribosome-binding protein
MIRGGIIEETVAAVRQQIFGVSEIGSGTGSRTQPLSQQRKRDAFVGGQRMADRYDGSTGMISQREAARRLDATADEDLQHAGDAVVEFVDAARSAAESLLHQQKQQVAERVAGFAEALRGAAESLDKSQNRVISRYVGQAAEQIENLSLTVGQRRWNEILADTEDFARRQPTWFVLGAVAAGFFVGRFLWATAGGEQHHWRSAPDATRSQTNRAVTAAVSSGSGAGSAGVEGYGAGSSGAMEAR